MANTVHLLSNGPSVIPVKYIDNGDGTYSLSVLGGSGGAGGAGTPVLDAGGVSWLWVYDKEAGTSIYISYATGMAGTPTFPVTPNADTAVQVSNFPATQPISAAALPLPAGAATSALQTAGNASLASIDSKAPALVGGRVPVEPLGIPGVARQIATTVASSNTALTAGMGRISIYARLAPLRYAVGSISQTASASASHYLAVGERIDIDVPSTPNIAVIRASDATIDGAAEITELS